MKVLLINGSPHENGNTAYALKEMQTVLEAEGLETVLMQVGAADIHGCTACGGCRQAGSCVYNETVQEAAKLLEEADGLILGAPVYYASMAGNMKSFLDCLFHSVSFSLTMKVGAGIAVARRAGTVATYDEFNKYFGIAGMPIASGTYWNSVFGTAPGDAAEDAEGLRTVRNIAHNMAFLIKSIALGKETYGMPVKETGAATNFIR